MNSDRLIGSVLLASAAAILAGVLLAYPVWDDPIFAHQSLGPVVDGEVPATGDLHLESPCN